MKAAKGDDQSRTGGVLRALARRGIIQVAFRANPVIATGGGPAKLPPQWHPIGDAGCGLDEAAVAHKGSASTWRKGPQRSLYTLATNYTGIELRSRRPIPTSEGRPENCRRTVELWPERARTL